MSHEIKIDIPPGQITNAIALAIAESFTDDKRDQLVRDVVRAHLTAKKDSFSRETILSEEVGKLIRSTASDILKSKLESEWRPMIEKVVDESLGYQFRDSVISSLRGALKALTLRNVNIRAEAVIDD